MLTSQPGDLGPRKWSERAVRAWVTAQNVVHANRTVRWEAVYDDQEAGGWFVAEYRRVNVEDNWRLVTTWHKGFKHFTGETPP